MFFVAGILVGLLVAVSVPGIVGAFAIRDMSMTNWRLARTCLVLMTLLMGGLFSIMVQVDSYTVNETFMVILSAIGFSTVAGIYGNAWFDHSTAAAEAQRDH